MTDQKMPAQNISQEQFEVFFDGDCPLCKKEIDMVRRLDVQNQLVLTNIADTSFNPKQVNRSLDTLMKEIHGRHADGRFVTGVEVFREIYGRIGFGHFVSISRWPLIRKLLDFSYKAFAYPRYRLALRRMGNSGACSSLDGSACHQTESISP